eukprot:c2941_g1_i2 orf=252-1487(-)
MEDFTPEEFPDDGAMDGHVSSDADSSSSDEEGSLRNQGGCNTRSFRGSHSYLGEVDDISCRSVFLEEGALLTLPLFYLEGIVLFPGATLPLRLIEARDKAALELAMHNEEAPCTLGVVHTLAITPYENVLQSALVGTTAEIRQLRTVAEGSINIVTRGCQRFRTVNVWTNSDGVVCAEVCILSEDLALHIPRDAFGKLASVPNYLSGKDPQCSAWPHWVYRMYDAYDLARRAADLWQQILELPSLYDMVRKPEILAYHIASKMPVQDATRQELLEINGVVSRLRREIQLLESMNHLKCKCCEALIAKQSDILVMSAEGPMDAFVNNYGFVHETLTLLQTQGLTLVGPAETQHSWFPGYSWTMAFCNVCKSHMGWLYKAVKKGMHPRQFWGVRRSQLVESTYQNSSSHLTEE